MSKNLQEYLQDNETVLWQGEPAAFPLIENGNKTRVLRTWLLTVVIIGGLLAAYVTKNSQWSMNVAIGMVVIGAVIMISPVFERASVKRQKYYITNQRAILEFDAKTFYSMDLSDIDDYKVVSDVANEDSVVLGSKIFEEVNKQPLESVPSYDRPSEHHESDPGGSTGFLWRKERGSCRGALGGP